MMGRVTRGSVALLVWALTPTRLPAQLGSLTATVTLGWSRGAKLWSVDRQPVAPFLGRSTPDTLALERSIGAGVSVGVELAYRPAAHLGLMAEFLYLDAPVRSNCRPIQVGSFVAPLCIASRQSNPSYGLTGGARLDLAPAASLRPYARAGAGATRFGVSTIAMDWVPPGFRAPIVVDPSPRKLAAMVLLAVGVGHAFGSKREVELELRDVMINFERVTGPATLAGVAPTRTQLAHLPVLAVGIRMDLRAVTR
jgi:hypothetical protein